MRFTTLFTALAFLLPAATPADSDAGCPKSAAASFSLPPRAPACTEDGHLACADGKPGCAASAADYAKLLQRKLPANWWSTPAEQIQACRQQRAQADPDHAWPSLAQPIEGSERIRLLVPGNSCTDQAASGFDVALAVKSDRGLVLKFLAEDYYDPHEDDPYSLALARNGADTLALVTVRGHDNHEMSMVTTAYRVDLATGGIAEYPLFLTAKGPGSVLESDEPTLNFDEDESSALVVNGKLAERFTQYSYLKDCPEDADPCPVDEVTGKTRYAWNGSAYAIDKSAAPPRADRARLAAHRQCLKAKFDARTGTGTADCPGDFADNCESNNDLSYLNYKAGKLDRARDYAGKALEECKGDPKQLAAAQFNDRRARGR
jgi:hypothetical protein